ncbi:FecR family protein [Pseudomonas sp. 21LCFQ010]|uniref:FecR family protein n=1 Tax=Pseudomonas sp. 21LCFQ010 TaxID=2957506 RepID=UPI002097992F|nr:FecR family protein [Pseudomonas sp. 21LCFQ010]MCO8161257.1 FecR family protein [Pseudomonas sp. 21LCFQ010]
MSVEQQTDPLEQAADWQIRLAEEPQAHAEFEAWLAADERHRQAWQQMQAMLGALGDVPARAVAHPSLRTARRPVTGSRRRRRWPQAALAGAVLALIIAVAPQASLSWRADYSTATAVTREVRLSDGSRVLLAPDSAISLSAESPRQVTLLKGQAYFEVVPDPARPFVASAGEMSVRVLGTAFDLNLQGQRGEVALQHGQVQVENARKQSALQLSERLLPGERLQVDWASGKVQRSTLDPARVAAWRQHMLYVEDLSVAEVVGRMQRYVPGWIVVADSALASRRISGVFDLRDPDRALQALARSLNVPLQTVTPWLRVL